MSQNKTKASLLDFKKHFLDHKIFWGFFSSFLALIVVFKFVYVPWKHQAMMNSYRHGDMHPKMNWIIEAQRKYHQKNRKYASQLKELLETKTDAKDHTEVVSQFKRQIKVYEKYPGLNYGDLHIGYRYYFEIRSADANNFLAQASFMGLSNFGEDVWQTDKTAKIVNKTESKVISDGRKNRFRSRVISWWLLGSIVLFFWGVGEKVYRKINGVSPQKSKK